MHPALLGLFILEAILYGLIAYVLLRKRTPYPDTRIGYHVGRPWQARRPGNMPTGLQGRFAAP